MATHTITRWVDTRTGDLDALETTDKSTLVDAINELHTALSDLAEVVDGLGGL